MNFQTSRCTIRPFQEIDIRPFMVYRNDLDWMRHQSFKDQSYEAYREALLHPFTLEEGIQRAILLTETNELLGDLYVKRETSGTWIGYTVTPSHARQGYAYEVVSALITHLKDQGETRILAGLLPANEASLALLKKLQFTYSHSEGDEQIYQLWVGR